MGLKLPTTLPWALLLLALAGLGREAWQAHARQGLIADLTAPPRAAPSVRTQHTNGSSAVDNMATTAGPDWLRDGRPLEVRVAQALALAQAGQDEPALARYRSLYDDPALGLLARYNAANVLLRRAMALREAGNTDQAYPLTELAKEGYRQVLRREPSHRPARYNLERALRLNPELDAEDLASVAPEKAERAVTTMRSTSQGLP
jgi:mxaK protein